MTLCSLVMRGPLFFFIINSIIKKNSECYEIICQNVHKKIIIQMKQQVMNCRVSHSTVTIMDKKKKEPP